jgi:hypothetical protein
MTVKRRRQQQRIGVTEWLSLLESDGPFLAAPVVRDAWPNGLPALDRDHVAGLRDTSAVLDASPGTRDHFVRSVLADFLGWGDRVRVGPDLPPGLVTPVPEHHTELRPDFALIRPDDEAPALLGMTTPPGTRAGARTTGSTWPASAADRLAYALRMQKVPLGLITDGTEWTLVCWVPGGAVATVSWSRHVWFDDVQTLQAFHALLCRQRFFGVEETSTLPALLQQSLDRQEEITERLKAQSQAVVDMLVATIGRLDVESRLRRGVGVLPDDIEPSEVYAGCVTVLMRTIFLLYAEERRLLPADDPIYGSAYAATTLAADLEERARGGEEVLERTSTAWQRLLATSRAIHRGARHQDLQLPAYGGSLFDPDRFPWLEGRRSADDGLVGATPLAIDDRTMLHSLKALQTLRFVGERRRLSFRQLDVEQIGYVYEGMMGQDAIRADGWVLGVAGDARGEGDGPELPLTEMELKLQEGREEFAEWLAPLTKTSGGSGRSEKAILRALLREADERIFRDVLAACGGDEPAARAIVPFGPLLRRDPRDLPVVYPGASLYLTDSELRANTGSVYTPRALAEQVVDGALAPLVHSPGPLDTEDRSQWRMLPPSQILALRIIDIAAGSGAFLVAATRYLADKLIEARAEHEGLVAQSQRHGDDLELQARREIVDHCIYGVDINPMAVEMCKLSLWLVTLDPARPFTYLDDRIRVGDSLLGITSVEQLVALHMDPAVGRAATRLPNFDADVGAVLANAAAVRQRIAEIDMIDTHDADDKARLLQQAEDVTDRLRRVADALSAASLAGERNYGSAGQLAAALFGGSGDAEDLEAEVRFRLTNKAGAVRHPAHCPLLFPEVFSREQPGFDAVIGNPPYLGGQKITGVLGIDYRDHLVRQRGRGTRGSADLVAYFLMTAGEIARRDRGTVGLITTNTIAQGDTREVGLDQVVSDGWDITGAVKSDKWPTRAVNLEYSIVWASRRQRGVGVHATADGAPVPRVTSSLDPAGRVAGRPYRLEANMGIAFQGSIVLGLGFTMTEAEARALIDRDPRNAEVLFPYVNGEDLNSRPDCSASRWVINFFDWPAERARQYQDCWAIVMERVWPERRRNNRQRYRDVWWQYAEGRPGLVSALAGLDRVLAMSRISKTVMPVFVRTGQVFNEKIVVFASDDPAFLAVLSSTLHYLWAIHFSSTLRKDLNYAPSDAFVTFPLPQLTSQMLEDGCRIDTRRRELMLSRQLGLTKSYNLVHDSRINDADIRNLRDIHVTIDEAVCAAYGWTDLVLDHGHYETRQGVRWTIAPAVQTEILDRLLALNHERHTEEEASGATQGPRRRSRRAAAAGQAELFTEGAL